MDEHIQKWFELRQQISMLEKKLDIHKEIIKKHMIKNDINSLPNSSNTLEINRTRSSSTRITKEFVPKQIWEEYARVNTYDVYNIRKVKK